MDFIPERSEIQISNIDAKDQVVKDLIRELGIKALVKQHKPERKPRNWANNSWKEPIRKKQKLKVKFCLF